MIIITTTTANYFINWCKFRRSNNGGNNKTNADDTQHITVKTQKSDFLD